MNPKPVLFLQNITIEGPGTIASFLEERNISFDVRDLYASDTIPGNPQDYGAVIPLGGPMNVDEEEKYPFLSAEKAFIQSCIQLRVPVLGICLGSQLLAASLGYRVKKNPQPEIGWMTVDITPEGERNVLFDGVESPLPVFQWHGDTFELPDRNRCMAQSQVCKNQAFSVNNTAFGLQFHIEVTEEDVKRWAKAYVNDVSGQYKETVTQLIELPDRQAAQVAQKSGKKILENFFIKVCGY